MRRFLCFAIIAFGILAAPVLAVAQNYESLFDNFDASELSRADKRFLQAALAFEGYYHGLLDGDWGGLSQEAMDRYAWQKFGTASEDWHVAVLAFSFFDIYERDGWAIRLVDGLNMSMLYPYDAVINQPNSESFVNWRHANSSLAYSVGIHSRTTTQRLHNYTVDQHSSSEEPYELRRDNVAITSVTLVDGGVLYTRSNYIGGEWSTVMLSADRRDVPILNAVAASLSVGDVPPVMFTVGGKLDQVISQAIAYADEGNQESQNVSDVAPQPATPETQKSSGTGFVVSMNGEVLTNAHVVAGCAKLTFDGSLASVVAESSDFDLAILQIEDWSGEHVATFSPAPARLNSDVTVVGYPLAGILSGLNVTRGAVSSQLGLGGEVTAMQITAPVQPGNSGGPVLAADGEVVGVVVSKLNAQRVADATGDIPQNVNFAVRGEIAKLFLFQNGIEPILGTDDTVLTPVDLADIAKNFTGFIECN